jgi:hypothetical protein
MDKLLQKGLVRIREKNLNTYLVTNLFVRVDTIKKKLDDNIYIY